MAERIGSQLDTASTLFSLSGSRRETRNVAEVYGEGGPHVGDERIECWMTFRCVAQKCPAATRSREGASSWRVPRPLQLPQPERLSVRSERRARGRLSRWRHLAGLVENASS